MEGLYRRRHTPLDNEQTTAFSDFDKGQVPVYYGQAGPGPLYQREAMLDDAIPQPAELGLDSGKVDHWKIGD